MASRLEEDLCCPVCEEVFRDPVILSCSHSYCRDCLQSWWRQKPTLDCPVCSRRSSRSDPPLNLVLKNLCESFLQDRDQRSSENVCSLHSERLQLFCLDHQQPVCLVCLHSHTHQNHSFEPIDEAAELHRQNLQRFLKPLQEKLLLCRRVQAEIHLTAEHIQVQARHTRRQIREQFQKLHRFLEEEEEARMASLREEEEQKSQMMKDKMEALSREIAALSDTVRTSEEQLRAEDVPLLLNYKAAVERVHQHPLLEDPQLPPGALIDQARHLGNLTFNIWSQMKSVVSYAPVVLDPNTASPGLTLAADLTEACFHVRLAGEKQLPDNPERFHQHMCSALGSEGFISGTHSWDVEVGDSANWTLGVLAGNWQNSQLSECWGVWFNAGRYLQLRYRSSNIHQVEQKIERVRVVLDWDGGTLTFSDPDTNTHIHTFTHRFTHSMFPYFETCDQHQLKVSQMKVSGIQTSYT